MTTNDTVYRTFADAIGGPPSDAYRVAWAALQACTTRELQHLRTDGIRAIQLSRIDEVVEVPVHQGVK